MLPGTQDLTPEQGSQRVKYSRNYSTTGHYFPCDTNHAPQGISSRLKAVCPAAQLRNHECRGWFRAL